MLVEDPGQTAMDALRCDATEIARTRGLDPSGVDAILGPALSEVSDALQTRAPTPDALTPDALTPDALTPDALGVAYESARATLSRLDERKAAGRYYTPEALVTPTVERTLAPLDVTGDNIAVCDPAAGGGAFLLAAMRAITDRLAPDERDTSRTAARRRAFDCVYGVDLDVHAARVARLSLWLEAADPDLEPEQTERQVRVADACVIDWHTEFKDPFSPESSGEPGGFDAVIGNPPWDIDKPDSRTFFSSVDPAYPRYTKQRALEAQRRMLAADPELARRWHEQNAAHARFGAWLRSEDSPFTRQGRGDGNRYKLFVELAWNIARSGGRFGLIVPSSLYTDAGSKPLRELLLNESDWEWLFGFENRTRVFAIDNRFKFAVVIATKGGTTQSVQTAFLRTDVEEWREPRDLVELTREQIETASPRSLAVPEIRDTRDAAIFERLKDTTAPLGEALDNKTLRYRRELDLTTQSHRFPPRDDWEGRGYLPSVDARWLKCGRIELQPPQSARELRQWTQLRGESVGWVHEDEIEDVALPLYEGRMIGQFDLSERGWTGGRGRRATWRDIPFEGMPKPIEPQFLFPANELELADPDHARPKLGFMAIASATNRRSMVATALLDAPCGNSVPTLRSADPADDLCVLAVLNSYVFDWALRLRLGGINLNRFVLAECPMLHRELRCELLGTEVAAIVAALCWTSPRHARAWRVAGLRVRPPALDHESRAKRRAVLDAAVACAFGLSEADFGWILRDTHHDCRELKDRAFTRQLDQKGFWRIDREFPHEARHPARALRAFHQLERETRDRRSRQAAIVAMCGQFAEVRAQDV